MNDSPIDDLHEELYGTRPAKGGEAYERLVAISTKLKDPATKVSHDQRPVGVSGQPHQVDVLTDDTYLQTKDYTKSGNKVDLDDVKNAAGTIPDLAEVVKAVVASATDFTEPARTFTAGAPLPKPVKLVHVRPTIPEDDKNRIKAIRLDLDVWVPHQCRIDAIVPTPEGNDILKAEYGGRVDLSATLQQLYRADGSVLLMSEALAKFPPTELMNPEAKTAPGEMKFEEPTFIRFQDGRLFPIQSIKYTLMFASFDPTRMTIARKGEPKLLYKEDREEGFNKVFTDEDLKRATITEDGEVQLHGPEAVSVTRGPRTEP